MRKTIVLIIVISLFINPAACAGYMIESDLVSAIGGKLEGEESYIRQCETSPFGQLGEEDYDGMYNDAVSKLEEGREFLDALSFFHCTENSDVLGCNDPRLLEILTDPEANFESVGLIEEFENDAKNKLLSAIDLFAILVMSNYSCSDCLDNLNAALRYLVTIYIVFGDEFMIDALDFRLSTNLVNLDQYYLDQIILLGKAIHYYESGLAIFGLYWSRAVGGSTIIAEHFTQQEWDVFALLLERMSNSLREKISRERAINPNDLPALKTELTQKLAAIYLNLSAMAKLKGEEFYETGGRRVLNGFEQLSKYARDMNNDLNPLGYDERYVPLTDFSTLHGLAATAASTSENLYNSVIQETRDFDYKADDVNRQKDLLNLQYSEQLEKLTGCQAPTAGGDYSQFLLCTEAVEGALYDCSIDLDLEAFEKCLDGKVSGLPQMKEKYREIKYADLQLDKVYQERENLHKNIALTEKYNREQARLIEVQYNNQVEALNRYLERIKDAVTIQKIKTTSRERGEDGKYQPKQKEKQTNKTFTIRDDTLKFSTQKEFEYLEITKNIEITKALDTTEIEKMLLGDATLCIDIDLAVQQRNSAILGFDELVVERNRIINSWQNNLDVYEKYYVQKLPEHRILLSDNVLRLSSTMRKAAHFAYLAAKALEYKYLKSMDDQNIGSIIDFNKDDIFKIQTPGELSDYLADLDAVDKLLCEMGTFESYPITISLARDILGFTRKNLGDLDNDNKVDDTGEDVNYIRFKKFQEFVNKNLNKDGDLYFTFSTPIDMPKFAISGETIPNLKIWSGSVPCSTQSSKGLAVYITYYNTNPSSSQAPHYLKLIQRGAHAFVDSDGDNAHLLPISVTSLANGEASESITVDKQVICCITDPTINNDDNWTNKFHNRSVAADVWEVTLYSKPSDQSWGEPGPLLFHKLEDIVFYIDAIGY